MQFSKKLQFIQSKLLWKLEKLVDKSFEKHLCNKIYTNETFKYHSVY